MDPTMWKVDSGIPLCKKHEPEKLTVRWLENPPFYGIYQEWCGFSGVFAVSFREGKDQNLFFSEHLYPLIPRNEQGDLNRTLI